ncbi:hypothetical protein P4C99_13670 [Pontiellaceae bacterium B1224]|nr:hypothetical protein [Pontiellaceae bacterium B1224]
MTRASVMGIVAAILIAALMHAALFVLVRPQTQVKLGGIPVVPKTAFLGNTGETFPTFGNDPRVVNSPVLFSLPSAMGFSRELTQWDVETRLTFSQQVESEQFLDAALMQKATDLDMQDLMVSSMAAPSLAIPADIFQKQEKGPSARRVTLAPELKERIVGGVVLPQELNQPAAKPWEVRAEVRVSEQGAVQHVFLNQPLESSALNMRILQLLYGLQFTPGEPVDGLVEIYSPESKPVEEVAE